MSSKINISSMTQTDVFHVFYILCETTMSVLKSQRKVKYFTDET